MCDTDSDSVTECLTSSSNFKAKIRARGPGLEREKGERERGGGEAGTGREVVLAVPAREGGREGGTDGRREGGREVLRLRREREPFPRIT